MESRLVCAVSLPRCSSLICNLYPYSALEYQDAILITLIDSFERCCADARQWQAAPGHRGERAWKLKMWLAAALF